MTLVTLSVVFFLLLAVGVPVALSIGLATMVAMLMSMDTLPALATIAQRMAGGINSFALLAIPLFILSGNIMSQGSIAQRLIGFARSCIGMLPGGLALVNIISCTLFGAISGSAIAATSAVGATMVPAMTKDKFPASFSAAVTATASTTGLLIPPSNTLIVYAVASGGVSIAALFVGGYLPGLLVAISLMIVSGLYARRQGILAPERSTFMATCRAFWAAAPGLGLIALVMGGIISGVFTATEAGAIAVVYALMLSLFFYRDIQLADLPAVLLRSVETTAIVMFLVSTSIAMSWLLAFQNVPTLVAEALLSVSDNPVVILLLINMALLAVGAFMDITPAVLIFTPIFLPVAMQLAMSPLQFGIMMVLNLSIGLCTPPVGSVLFVSSAIAKVPLEKMLKPLFPLYAAMMAALLAVTYVPELSEGLPRVMGLID